MTEIDEPTFRAIVERWAPALRLYARQWCLAPEDAVQEALIELLREPNIPQNLAAWLFRVVRYRSQNQARAQRRREQHEQVAATQRGWFDVPKDSNDFLDVECLSVALAALDKVDREIVVARIWGQLGWVQIGELVNRPVSTIHRRYTHALQILKTQLSQSSSPTGDSHERLYKS